MADLEKLQTLVDFVRSNPVPKLNLTSWCKMSAECGTTHCIIGWAAQNGLFDLALEPVGDPRSSAIDHMLLEHGKQALGDVSFSLLYKDYQRLFTWAFYPIGVSQEIVLNRIQDFIDGERENGM